MGERRPSARVRPLLRCGLLLLGCWLADPEQVAAQRSAEQEVLAFVIREFGAGAVVMDSTYSHDCRGSEEGMCAKPDGVSPELWAGYLDAIRSRAAVRDLLAADPVVTLASEHPESASTPCKRRRWKLQLSRAGVGPDGREAIVSYSVWSPMDHLGCGAVHGRTVLLRRTPPREWEIVETLSIVIS